MIKRKPLPWDEYRAYREVTAHPEWRGETRFSLSALKKAAESASVLYRGWPFIYVDLRSEDTVARSERLETEVELSEIRGYPSFERWELRRSGFFFHKTPMEEAVIPRVVMRGRLLDVTLTVLHVSEAIGSLWRLYGALDVPDDETIDITIRFTDMAQRRVEVAVNPDRAPIQPSPRPAATDVIEWCASQPLGAWRADEVELAVAASVELFEQAGWLDPNRPAIEGQVRSLLGRRVPQAV